jgi:hypothetical protein
MGIVSLCLVLSVVGCASRTRVGFGQRTVGLSSEAHEWRPIGVSKNAQGENVLCLGMISLGSFASNDPVDPVTGPRPLLSLTSQTGKTSDVNK